jgi:glyoxylate/hydroxypyruvate reductase
MTVSMRNISDGAARAAGEVAAPARSANPAMRDLARRADLSVAVVVDDARERERWVRELGPLLPGARVFGWNGGAATARYAVGWNPPVDFFAGCTGLEAFFNGGAGVDRLLGRAEIPEALPLVRLEDAGMARQMAEYCCHEVFRVYRRWDEYEAQQRACVWRELEPVPADEFAVGVLGLGALGSHVARTLAGFGYRVLGHARSPRAIEGVECFAGDVALPAFLANCSVLILMAPLTDETRDLIDARALAALPPGAWLVNVARGGLVDEEALLAALDSGRLAGATLDVFRIEPLPDDHPFWRHPRVRVTPHASAVTLVPESARQIAGKILSLERGEAVSGVVDRARGY